MEEVAENEGMNYPEIPDSRYVVTIEEPRTPSSEPLRQPPAMRARPALRSMENLQNSQQLFTQTFCKYLFFGISFVPFNYLIFSISFQL